jgi:hypothetical protein
VSVVEIWFATQLFLHCNKLCEGGGGYWKTLLVRCGKHLPDLMLLYPRRQYSATLDVFITKFPGIHFAFKVLVQCLACYMRLLTAGSFYRAFVHYCSLYEEKRDGRFQHKWNVADFKHVSKWSHIWMTSTMLPWTWAWLVSDRPLLVNKICPSIQALVSTSMLINI